MTVHRPTRDTLNSLVEFYCPFIVHGDGRVTTNPTGAPYCPEVHHVEHGNGVEICDERWGFVDGFSGQFRYSGPVMHASEYLGGRMAEHVLSQPGTYCLAVVEVIDDPDDDDPEPAGWILLYIDPPAELVEPDQGEPYWLGEIEPGVWGTATLADGWEGLTACPVADASLSADGARQAHEFYHSPRGD